MCGDCTLDRLLRFMPIFYGFDVQGKNDCFLSRNDLCSYQISAFINGNRIPKISETKVLKIRKKTLILVHYITHYVYELEVWCSIGILSFCLQQWKYSLNDICTMNLNMSVYDLHFGCFGTYGRHVFSNFASFYVSYMPSLYWKKLFRYKYLVHAYT